MRSDNTTALEKNIMTEGSIQKKLISFAIPLFLGNLFQQMYNAVDSFIVGNFEGKEALAAVSTAGNLIFMIVGFFNGISVGAGVVIARFIGARDDENTEKAVHTTVALGLIFSILMTIIGVGLTPVFLTWMNTPANVFPESSMYFRVYFAGSLGLVMYNVLVGILQASGDSKNPLKYLIISSVVNTLLDLLFVAVLGMGVGGAGLATAIAQLLSAVLCFIRLVRSKEVYGIVPKRIRLDIPMVKNVFRFGLPSGLQNSIMSFSNVVIQSFINAYGDNAMAGIGAYVKIEGFVFIPVNAFAMAIATFVSQNLGAGEYERTKKGIRFGMFCVMIAAEILGLLLFIFAEPLVSVFIKDHDPEVVAYGMMRSRIVTLFFFLCAFTHFMAAVLRGAGKPMVPMFVFLFCWCAMRVLILFVAEMFIHTIYTTFIVYPVTWILSSVTLFIYYRRLKFDKDTHYGM
jgi:putative MATE family efflux protein